MSSQTRLTKAYQSAQRILFDDDSKFIIFSDVHRGDNSFADDFANNRNVYFHALSHYFDAGFTYLELGDGDELWEVMDFDTIFEAHRQVFQLLKKYYRENRYHRVLGNHDMVMRSKRFVEKHLHSYLDKITDQEVPLFPGIQLPEGIVLLHRDNKQELFLTHGHQAEWMNYHGWKVNRFLVQVLWRPLQIFGIGDPTSPARNYRELKRVEKRCKRWILNNRNLITIMGHTHRPRFPEPGEIPLFNDGSCVHPRSITGLEIESGKISLIKWHIATTRDGTLRVERNLLEGPQELCDYKRT